MDEFLNACSVRPPGVSIQNPPANQVTWPTTLLLAWAYTKLPLFSIQHHYKSTEYRKEIAKQQGSWGKGDDLYLPPQLLWVFKDGWHTVLLTSTEDLKGCQVLSNLAVILLILFLGFAGGEFLATDSQGKTCPTEVLHITLSHSMHHILQLCSWLLHHSWVKLMAETSF